jgi:hypothetical protein
MAGDSLPARNRRREMSLTLPSRRQEFAGFGAYYEASIAPHLADMERRRVEAVNKTFIAGVSTAALAIAAAKLAPIPGVNVHLAIFIAMSGLAGCAFLLRRARNDITRGLIEKIAGKLNFRYRGEMARPDYNQQFRRLKLLPGHNREEWEDEVEGAHAGAIFRFCEAHLKFKSSGKNSSTRTVFHGQLFVIDYPKKFLGTTVVQRDMGALNALMKPSKEFQRVGLASPVFERAFEAWSTDQVEARDLLDPLVLERFQELERLFGGKKLRAAFDDGKLLIALETGDRLSIGSMFKPIEGAGRVEAILREFDLIFDLIDILLRRVDRPIAGAFSVSHVKGGAGR